MKKITSKSVLGHFVCLCIVFFIGSQPCASLAQAVEPRSTLLVIANGLSLETNAALRKEITALLKNGAVSDELVVVAGPNHTPIARLVLPSGDLKQRLRNRDVLNAISSIGKLLDGPFDNDPATALQVGLPQLAGTYWSMLAGKRNVRVVLAGTPLYHDIRFPFWSFRGSSFPSDRALTDPSSSCPFINRSHRKIPAEVEVVFLCPTEWGSNTRHQKMVIRWTQLALSESIGGELKRLTTNANAAFQPIENSGFEPVVFDDNALVGMWTLTSGTHRELRPESPTDSKTVKPATNKDNEPAPDDASVRSDVPPALSQDVTDAQSPVLVTDPRTEKNGTETRETIVDNDLSSTTDSGAPPTPVGTVPEPEIVDEPNARDIGQETEMLPAATSAFQGKIPDATVVIESAYDQFPVSIRSQILSEVTKHPQAIVVVLSWKSQCPHADLNLHVSRFRCVFQNAPRGSGADDLETIEWAILDDSSPLETGGAWVNLFETHREVTAQVRVTSMESGLSRTTELNFGRSPDHGTDRNRRAKSSAWKQLDMKKMRASID